MFLKIFFVICIQINFVYNCDDSVSDVTDTLGINEEYLNIFRTIPTLFEYVMGVIDEKPEILEKDDISVFTMDSRKYSDEISSRDGSRIFANEHDSESKEKADIENSDSDEYGFSSSKEDEEDSSSIEDTYVDSDSTEYLDSSKDEDDDDDNYDDDDDDGDDDNNKYDEIGDFWNWFVGTVASKTSSLTPTEIAEKTLEIEKQLEEYNTNNKS